MWLFAMVGGEGEGRRPLFSALAKLITLATQSWTSVCSVLEVKGKRWNHFDIEARKFIIS